MPHSAQSTDLGTRHSLYVAVRDGTHLAAHTFLPRGTGEGGSRLPALLCLDRYHTIREILHAPTVLGAGATYREWLRHLLAAGYAVVLVDARGAGASFGTSEGPFGGSEVRDVYDVSEWVAAQPWCNGRVGMVGRSYSGTVQYLAAAHRPPHLRAIFAEMAMGDLYEFAYSGGVFRHDFAENWQRRVRELDRHADAVPVDDDAHRDALRVAQSEHAANRDVYGMFAALPYRDSVDARDGSEPYVERSPMAHRGAIGASGIPICHYSGWLDIWVRDAVRWLRNLPNTQALTIGPWPHGGGMGAALAQAQDEWFGPWLKEGDGTPHPMSGQIRFAPLGGGAGLTWRTVTAWPPSDTRSITLYLNEGRSGTVHSCNDGHLRARRDGSRGVDVLVVDATSTTGQASRWSNGYGADFGYPDMTEHAQRCLTYTTSPLRDVAEVVGHPQVRLWVTTAAQDVAVFAYLERVYPDGASDYLTEGCLRASHRAVEKPTFDNLGLPFHPSTAASLRGGLHEPVELWFDLHPIAARIAAGERLRVCVTGADRNNALAPRLTPESPLRIHRGDAHRSCITLPVMGSLTI